MPSKKRRQGVAKSAQGNDESVTKVRDLYSSGQSLRSIAEATGIKESRISKIIKGHVTSNKRPTRKVAPPVSDLQSTAFLQFLQYLKPICWNWKLRTFRQILEKYAEDTGSIVSFTQAWRQEYVEKHEAVLPKRIVELFSMKNSKDSATLVTTEEVFDTISDLYKQLGIGQMPHCIWAFDAVDIELPEPPKKKIPGNLNTENSTPEYASALYAASASGEFSPGTLLFKGVRIASEWKCQLKDADKEKLVLLVNSSGKCDFTALSKWLKTVFIKKVQPRPIVLFVDGIYSHPDNYEFIKAAFDEQIYIVSLPPKMSNIKLPLAVNVRGSFKDKWYEGLDEQQLTVCPTSSLSRAQVVETFTAAVEVFSAEVAKDGFMICGFCPLNPDADPSEKKELSMLGDEDVIEITLDPPLSPETQEAVDEALAVFARAGVSEIRAKRLLRNMNVPGFGIGF